LQSVDGWHEYVRCESSVAHEHATTGSLFEKRRTTNSKTTGSSAKGDDGSTRGGG
jgi:hypothetical protein